VLVERIDDFGNRRSDLLGQGVKIDRGRLPPRTVPGLPPVAGADLPIQNLFGRRALPTMLRQVLAALRSEPFCLFPDPRTLARHETHPKIAAAK